MRLSYYYNSGSHDHVLFPVLLDLSSNSFTGPVRNAFSLFRNLDFIDLSANEFTGVVPSSLFEISTIRLVYLDDNQFEGSIPSNIGRAESLRDLYLHGNNLAGQIPSIEPGQLGNLTELLLQRNNLSGQMPASICSLRTPSGKLENLWADCAEDNSGVLKVVCPCCTQCEFS